MNAIITYRPNSQKTSGLIRSLLTPEILRDICARVTGQTKYSLIEQNDTYNRGRLLWVDYSGIRNYVTFSEARIDGRNSSLQSVPTAINLFYADSNPNKKLYYYFLPHIGNLFTEYHLLYYRLLATAGVEFLNIRDYFHGSIFPYTNVDEIISDRNTNSSSNGGNNSSFVTKTKEKVQLYAKTYGASKYESTIIGVALSKVTDRPIDVFAVSEQDLLDLPSSSMATFSLLGNISTYRTSLHLNPNTPETAETTKLRSAAYLYNLLGRLGMKKCALCGCEVPEIIQGAHIWGVSNIRNSMRLDDGQRYHHATSGHNGLWLCHNHHKLFDSNIIVISPDGYYMVKDSLPKVQESFVRDTMLNSRVGLEVLSDDFRYYLSERNTGIDFNHYITV